MRDTALISSPPTGVLGTVVRNERETRVAGEGHASVVAIDGFMGIRRRNVV